MISVDGLSPGYVTQAGEHHLHVPVLQRFMQQGTYADGVVGVVPTLTYPGHTTLVTGVSPEKHGIYNNVRFDPLGRNKEAWYWYASDIKAPQDNYRCVPKPYCMVQTVNFRGKGRNV
jgi:predicted AlkP superfamily pyrophosphatase or phosphodiesterase